MNDELEKLKYDLDVVMVQSALLKVELNVLNSMIFGVYKSKLTSEEFENVSANYQERLEHEVNSALENLEDIVFDKSMLKRQRFEFFSDQQARKHGS